MKYGSITQMLGGAALLYLGAEWLVRGGAGLARRIGVSPLIIGLTIVAFGTSAPEVMVGIQAGWMGHGDLALGNIIGSNIANLGLILGLAALIRPTKVPETLAKREVPVLLLSTLALVLMLWNGRLSSLEASLLLVSALAYSAWMVHRARRDQATDLHLAVEEDAAESAGAPKGGSMLRLGALVAVGLVFLVLGGHLLVQGASSVAMAMGMSERMIGLTIVAIGTSIPELATSCVAAWRGHSDIAVGNVVGSNILNVLLCLGSAGLPGQISALRTASNPDLFALTLFTLLALLLLRTERTIRRWEGGLMLGGYLAYLLGLIFKG